MTPSRPTPAGEVGGAFGDLGTLLPILLGAVAVGGMAAGGVLVGFGAFLLATGLLYRLPLPVQPMKAIGALVVAGGLSPGEVAAAGAVELHTGTDGAVAGYGWGLLPLEAPTDAPAFVFEHLPPEGGSC